MSRYWARTFRKDDARCRIFIRLTRVDEGNTVTDFDDDEIQPRRSRLGARPNLDVVLMQAD